LTGDGSVGQLWRCSDAQGLTRALHALALLLSGELSSAVRAHFERELSFAALGLKLQRAYLHLTRREHLHWATRERR
jgi:hypothetical protein